MENRDAKERPVRTLRAHKLLHKLLPKRKIKPRIDNELLTTVLVNEQRKSDTAFCVIVTGLMAIMCSGAVLAMLYILTN